MKKIKFLSKKEICLELEKSGKFDAYLKMNDYHRQMFMDFCSGKSMKMLTYDSIFKRIFQANGDFFRLESFMTAVLGFQVYIEKVMPLESEKMIESGSILSVDVLAKTKDGSIINVEMQKYPYEFCGEREACYQSDMIMRQYNALKYEARGKKEKFNYSDLRPVYTIILLEKSYYSFLEHKDKWIHRGKMQFDTGIELSYPFNVTYIAIDNFGEIEENIDSKLKQWVYLFGADTPDKIVQAAGMSEDFFDIVCDISEFCRDISGVMDVFSDALRMLDRNTEEYMHEQMLKELTKQKEELAENKQQIEKQKAELEKNKAELEQNKAELEQNKAELEQNKAELEQNKAELEQNKTELELSKNILRGFLQGKSKEDLAREYNMSIDELEKMV